jgi:hypothetical protein
MAFPLIIPIILVGLALGKNIIERDTKKTIKSSKKRGKQ